MPVSTEQIIADMHGWTDLKAYFEGARGKIDADLAKALQRAGDNTRIFHIDQNAGDDTAVGTPGAPLRSLEEALSRTMAGGVLKVRLLSDYVVSSIVDVDVASIDIATASGQAQKTLSFAPQIDATDTRSPRLSPRFRNCIFRFAGLEVLLGAVSPHVTQKFVLGAPGMTSVLIQSSTMTLAAGADQVMAQALGGFGIAAQNITGDLSGHWIEGVASGTLPTATRFCTFATVTHL